MKRLKVFLIIVISVLLVVLSGNIVFGSARGSKRSLNSNNKLYIKYNSTLFNEMKNVYCVHLRTKY